MSSFFLRLRPACTFFRETRLSTVLGIPSVRFPPAFLIHSVQEVNPGDFACPLSSVVSFFFRLFLSHVPDSQLDPCLFLPQNSDVQKFQMKQIHHPNFWYIPLTHWDCTTTVNAFFVERNSLNDFRISWRTHDKQGRRTVSLTLSVRSQSFLDASFILSFPRHSIPWISQSRNHSVHLHRNRPTTRRNLFPLHFLHVLVERIEIEMGILGSDGRWKWLGRWERFMKGRFGFGT